MNKINYDKHDWIDGEPITEALFDNIESGIGRATSSTNLLVDRTNQEEEDLSTTEGKIEHQDMEFDIAIGEHDTLDERLKADVSRFVEVWSGGNYMPFEGKNIRIDNSKVGWIRDLKISGETYQDPNNLSDIQSAGDLVDGRYKIEILSHGKNLINITEWVNGSWNGTTGIFEKPPERVNQRLSSKFKNKLLTNNPIVFSANKSFNIAIRYYDENNNFISDVSGFLPNKTSTPPVNAKYFTLTLAKDDITQDVNIEWVNSLNLQMEEGTVATSYEPHKENKKEILLSLDGGLKSLPSGVADTIEQREDGVYLVQRIEKVAYTTGDENLENCITDNTVSYKAKATPIETKLDLDMSKWLTYQDVTYFTTTCNVQPTLSLKAPVDINAVVSELQTANYSLRRNNQQLEQENQQAEKELNVLQEQHDQQTADLLDMDMRVLILEE